MPDDLLRRLHVVIRRYFASDEAYAVLDANPDTDGCTWMSGGCGVAALALLEALPGATLAHLVSTTPGYRHPTPQHFVVSYRGMLLDADGVSTEAALVDHWERVERLGHVALVPSNREILLESEVPGGWNSLHGREDSEFVAAALMVQPDWPLPPAVPGVTPETPLEA